jgi:restriction system protein
MISAHLKALRTKKLQLVTSDAYGKPQLERWDKEVEYFVGNHIRPFLGPRELADLQKAGICINDLVCKQLAAEEAREPLLPTFSDGMSPSEFEAFCAEELRRNGWQARVTLQSRDQGVDVIAEKDHLRVVLQCKLYTSPVGNHAVQEAAAARAHEQANFGIVVSNQRYTEPARQLAATNGILLLHFRDLKDLSSLIEPKQKA